MIIVCLMFWYLDTFYLAFERLHRDNEKDFVSELKKENYSIEELILSFSTKGNNKLVLTLKAMWSTSCFPFYNSNSANSNSYMGHCLSLMIRL